MSCCLEFTMMTQWIRTGSELDALICAPSYSTKGFVPFQFVVPHTLSRLAAFAQIYDKYATSRICAPLACFLCFVAAFIHRSATGWCKHMNELE